MSKRIITFCDFCNTNQHGIGNSRFESWAEYPRKELKEFGWKVVKGLDMCPKCIEEGAR